MTTTEWGPMGRVRARQLAQRVEDTQRGTEWVVRRVKLEKVKKWGVEEFKPVVTELGSVYAYDKSDAERKAIRKYGDGVTVQSAISAKMTQEETEGVMRGRAFKTNHRGRPARR